MTTIAVDGLTKRFGDVTAVDDLTFRLEARPLPGGGFGVIAHIPYEEAT